jgi:hypothetical protein
MIHVVPNGDRKPHELDIDCKCAPKIQDGVLIHNSHDARELKQKMHEEQGRPKPDNDGWAVVDSSEIQTTVWQ